MTDRWHQSWKDYGHIELLCNDGGKTMIWWWKKIMKPNQANRYLDVSITRSVTAYISLMNEMEILQFCKS